MWGNFQSSGSNDWIPNITYDNRWPITGHDTAINIAVNLTHTRGAHTFKFGPMRERENFGQARSGRSAASSTSPTTPRTRTTPGLPFPTPFSAR